MFNLIWFVEQTAKKYLTKAELEREREEKYREEQARLEEEKRKKQREKVSFCLFWTVSQRISQQQEIEERMRIGRPQRAVDEMKEVEYVCKLPVEDVKKRLRKRGEPITLFGESDALREKRLIELEVRLSL